MGVEQICAAVKGRMVLLQVVGGPALASAWLGEIMALPVNQYPAARVIPEVESEDDRTTGYRTEVVNLTIWVDLLWEDSEENMAQLLRITQALRDDLRANPELGGAASEVQIGESHYVLTSRGGDTFRTSITQVRYEHEVPD